MPKVKFLVRKEYRYRKPFTSEIDKRRVDLYIESKTPLPDEFHKALMLLIQTFIKDE